MAKKAAKKGGKKKQAQLKENKLPGGYHYLLIAILSVRGASKTKKKKPTKGGKK